MRLRHHYRALDLGRRIALRTLAAFLVTFAVLRIITAIIHYDLFPHGPFRDLITRKRAPHSSRLFTRASCC